MITELYTERLYLRKMKAEDAPGLFAIWSDPEVARFMNITAFTDVEEAGEMISFLNQLAEENKAIRFSIVETASNQIIGSCGYNSLDFDNAKAEIGYDIAKSHWGKGYASEAVRSLLDHAFTSLHLHRIEAKVEPENLPSIKLLQKLRFTFEGTLRQSERSKGRFIDLNMYAKLRTEE